jgi:hypothetical protein
VRHQVWKRVPKILARRKIRNEEEYYLLMERLNDVGPDGLDGSERELGNDLVLEFEERVSKRRDGA